VLGAGVPGYAENMTISRPLLITFLLVAALGGTVFAKVKFSSVWAAPEAAAASFGGQKVVALVIDKDESLRISAEESLARELTDRGMQGVPAYRLVPKEILGKPDEVKGWFERAGVQGVVALRVVNDQKTREYQPATWSSAYYSTLWGYYGYGYGVVYDPGYTRDTRVIALETLIYSVPKNMLLWGGASESKNPKDSRKLLADLVKEAVKEMKKQGLSVK
jgi:hypothetical protein